MMISGTKINYNFPNDQIQMKGFNTTFRLGTYKNGGGVIIFAKEDIPDPSKRKCLC